MTAAVDLFAGLGGFTAGATAAGARVVWAANHWPVAVEWHAINHPGTTHLCQDLHQADWTQVPEHDLLLASPACQGHTPARGKDRPHHDATRATAWAVVSCAEIHRPAAVVVENVPAFLNWALYPAWSYAMESLGYRLAPHIIDCADLGVPQHRERVFIVGTRSSAPVMLSLPKRDHVPVRSLIDFAAGKWSQVGRPGRSLKTLSRVTRARADGFGDRFVMPYYGAGSGLTGRCLDRPLGTVTTRDRWAVVDGDRMRMLSVPEYRAAMGFSDDYRLPENRAKAIHLLGNAVPPLAAQAVVSAVMEAA